MEEGIEGAEANEGRGLVGRWIFVTTRDYWVTVVALRGCHVACSLELCFAVVVEFQRRLQCLLLGAFDAILSLFADS